MIGGGGTPYATVTPPDSVRRVSDEPGELDPEDRKIVQLARATRARSAAAEGAAVRDQDGRTYTAAAVQLPSLQLSALALAVAMAASSGAQRLEAAAVVTDYRRTSARGPRRRPRPGGVRRPGAARRRVRHRRRAFDHLR